MIVRSILLGKIFGHKTHPKFNSAAVCNIKTDFSRKDRAPYNRESTVIVKTSWVIKTDISYHGHFISVVSIKLGLRLLLFNGDVHYSCDVVLVSYFFDILCLFFKKLILTINLLFFR